MARKGEKHMSLTGLSCIFPVPNIRKTAEFYVSSFGFQAVEYLMCEEPHICLYKDAVEILLLEANTARVYPNRELYGYGYDAYFYTEDQALLEKELLEKGVKIVRPLHLTDYRNRELVAEDLDGRWLAFGAKIKG